ncbi:hypothetical protein Tco_0973572 [Tanacetum coccineum]
MSADSAVTYTTVHSKAQSWSIPSEDPYAEAARQLLEQAPRSPKYVPDPMELEDHVPVYIPDPEHPEDLVPAEDEAPIEVYITEVASAPPPPPSLLPSVIRPPRTRATMTQMRAAAPSTYHLLLPSGTPPLLPIPLPAPSTSRKADIPEADTPPRKRLLLTAPKPGCGCCESYAASAVIQPVPTRPVVSIAFLSEFYSRHHDAQKDRAVVRAEIEVLRRERLAYEQESMETRQALARSEAYNRELEARVTVLETQARLHEWQRQDEDDRATRHIMRIQALEAGARDDTLEDTGSSAYGYFSTILSIPVTPTLTTTTVTKAQLQALIDRGVTTAMVEAEASRVRNGYDKNGTEGVVGLTRWFEKMEPLLPNGLMPKPSGPPPTLKKMMIDKYYPRGEIKKIEIEMWNLKVKGADVVAYNRRFQQLALMCARMFPEEVDKIEKYIGGLPDMILGSVKASKPKTMQEAIEFTTELMDEKTHAYAERQAEKKRKYDDLSKNNQNQQQQNKRQNTCQAYTAGNSDRKPYVGSKPLCSKCNYNHEGPCPPRYNNCKKVTNLAKDCKSRPANANNNNCNNNNNNQKGNGCYEYGAQGHFKKLQN